MDPEVQEAAQGAGGAQASGMDPEAQEDAPGAQESGMDPEAQEDAPGAQASGRDLEAQEDAPGAQASGGPVLLRVRGVPFIDHFARNWPHVEAFEARPDDVLIATYPKSGTTWVSEMADLIRHGGQAAPCRRAPIYERVPFLEFAVPGLPTGVEQLRGMPGPRLIKTHLPVELLPPSFWQQRCKVVYVGRNAKDVAVSYYHFYRMAKVHPAPGPWDVFLRHFCQGEVSFGSWFAHVRGWWEKRAQAPLLYLFYEDLQEDAGREARRLAAFLGRRLGPEEAAAVLRHSAFGAMRANAMANYRTLPPAVMDQRVSPFLRKGVTGDWRNQFTVAQAEAFERLYRQRMAGTDLRFRDRL
ncbi:sulfotransferase 1B1-like [Struthio camelus]|uniref:sulfotransferase 1B1-like n=1 Tax=Struthio camelus TaxID=8801 RepID=UPI003603C2B5